MFTPAARSGSVCGMRAWLVVGLLLGAGLGISLAVPSRGAAPAAGKTSAVEAEYTGDWVCQTFMPGYNIRPPSADASQPLTNHMTTPSTVVVLKLTLRTDGTYVTADGRGRYALDQAARTVTWLDGPHREALMKTQLGRRDNGAPTLGFVKDKRYYGCFKPERKERGR
jgi:hypothetical protein